MKVCSEVENTMPRKSKTVVEVKLPPKITSLLTLSITTGTVCTVPVVVEDEKFGVAIPATFSCTFVLTLLSVSMLRIRKSLADWLSIVIDGTR